MSMISRTKRLRWMMLFVVFVASVAFSSSAFATLKLVASPGYAHCQHPKWAPNGSKLAYEVQYMKKSIIEIHIRNMSSNKVKRVRPSALQSGGFSLGGGNDKRGQVAKEFSWSPKSNKYLFSSNGTGTVYNIYLSQEGILKSNHRIKSDGHPAWSKNGKLIAFTSGRTGNGDLYFARMTGTNLKAQRLTKSSSSDLFPVWSPTNPLQLAYLRSTGQSDRIYLITNVWAKQKKRLTKWRSSVSELNPSWSPDGTKIAFFGQNPKTRRYDLYVVAAKPGSKPKRLARNVVKSDQYGPAWAPNSKKIIFVQKLSKERDLMYAIDVNSGAKKKITTNTVNNNELSVVAKGGKWHIAFTAQGRKGATNLVYRKLYIKTINPM